MSNKTNTLAQGRGKQSLIVFVHGFWSSPETWNTLVRLLKQDRQINDVFDLETFGYDTQIINLNVKTRTPSLNDVANRLRGFIEGSRFAHYRDITLVGHSQGGLIIQYYLANALTGGNGARLARVRQVLLFATPNLGSAFLMGLRKFVSLIPGFNRQEKSLRALDEEISDMRAEILKRVVVAGYRGRHCYPIPVQCFAGTNDGIVPPASAAGNFINVQKMRADHSSIIEPESHDDERYQLFRDRLLSPAGHSHCFEVDEYKTLIEVRPRDPNEPIAMQESRRTDSVRSDNIACVNRQVTFSKNNICEDLYEIRYATRKEGLLVPKPRPRNNQAPPKYQRAYVDYLNTFYYQFRPEPRKRYELNLDVYRGFDAGDRRVHFHLGKKAYTKKYIWRLDLKAYRAAGYTISDQPLLYFDPDEPLDHTTCDARKLESPEPCTLEDLSGIWEWELEHVREGIVDLVWDLSKP